MMGDTRSLIDGEANAPVAHSSYASKGSEAVTGGHFQTELTEKISRGNLPDCMISIVQRLP